MDTQTVTISGKQFTIAAPYAEGHVLTANEAAALNQTFRENIRNQLAKRVAEGTAGQADVDAVAESYRFDTRGHGGGGARRDPVMAEALRQATEMVKDLIKQKGHNLSDYPAATIKQYAEQVLERRPNLVDEARERIAAQRAKAAETLSALGDLLEEPPAPAEQAPEAGYAEEPVEAESGSRRKRAAA